jgi:hypothetical protein
VDRAQMQGGRTKALKTAGADLAFGSINSKRADVVIVDRQGFAILAVKYQGPGHYQGTARLRDAVKREAFRSAGAVRQGRHRPIRPDHPHRRRRMSLNKPSDPFRASA